MAAATQRVWLITGTSTGFGRELTRSALARGDKVIATARDVRKIQDLQSAGASTLHMDVTDNFEKLRSTAKDAIDIYGKVDVLVNNAGLSIHGATEDLGVSSYLKTFQTNVFGMIGVTNAFLPHFRSRRDGTLVMMGSRSAWKPLPVKSHAFAFIVDELCSLRGRRYRAWGLILALKRRFMVWLFNLFANGISGMYAKRSVAKAIAESLSQEVTPFNIRTLIVQPGAHRTSIIFKTQFGGSPSSPYRLDSRWFGEFQRTGDKQPGDAKRAVERIVDVVRGEGVAAGKPWPLWLFLGKDSEETVNGKIEEVAKNLDQWKDVVRSTGIDE